MTLDRIVILGSATASLLGIWMLGRAVGVAGLPGCGDGSACDEVTTGRWSRWGPIPVAGLGAATYLMMTATAVADNLAATGNFRPLINGTMNAVSMMVLGAACWFVYLQVAVIRRVCGYCAATHAIASSAAILILIQTRWSSTASIWIACATSAAAITALIAGQILIAPKIYAVTPAVGSMGEVEKVTSTVSARSGRYIP